MLTEAIAAEFERVAQTIERGPLYPQVRVEEVRSYLQSRYDFREATNIDDVVADVERMMQTWQVQVTHPRYFGLFNPNVTLASVVADTLVAMYNPQLANWRTSPAANEMERHTLNWLAGKFGLPSEAVATFTSGGSEANLSALVVALTKSFPGYGEDGVRAIGAQPTIYLTAESHNGYNKLSHIAGLGRRALRKIATDARLKMKVSDLERQVAEDRRSGCAPFMVIGTAGTTGTGVIDPLCEIGRFCRESGLWFHVDAAWGGAAILSPALRTHLAGIESADSITCDAHKWLSVPMGSGMLFCCHPESVAQAFRTELTYMLGKQDGPVSDPLATSIQWSRRFIGLKLFMSLAERGEAGFAAMIEQQAEMGNLLRELLVASGWLVVNDTPLPLVCFTRDGLDVPKFLNELRNRQIAWMSPVTVSGVPAVRACITNFKTTEQDVRWVVDEISKVAGRSSAAERMAHA
ncbi:MAG: pyridoxal-dependent decarboxylase [Acidobacteriaceae bacterium]